MAGTAIPNISEEGSLEKLERALHKVPFIAGLTDAELRSLAREVEVREYPAGAVIVAQGEVGTDLYILLEGQAGVEHHAGTGANTTRLNELGPGDFFGEIALLEDLPRSADVVAITPTTCAVLSREVFRASLMASPEVVAALLAALSHRVRALSELVEQPHVESKAPPRERERRILELGEAAMTGDIRSALLIKEQNHFTLFDPDGNIPVGNAAGFGLYLGDTRHLSGYEITLGRVEAVVLVSTAQLGYAADQQLTNRDLRQHGSTIRKETLLIGRERLAHDAGFDERITVSNFNPFAVDISIQIRFAADFADIFEVRGVGRPQRGRRLPARVSPGSVILSYEGLDDRTYETRLSFSPAPTRLRSGSVQYRARVEPLGRISIDIGIAARVADHDDQPQGELLAQAPTTEARLADARTSYQEWLAAATVLESDNALFDAAITRSLLDLRLLVNRLDGQWLFGAGIPWYATLFGRDSLITGFEMLAWNPDLAADILRLLARYQGTRHDDWRDEEPGKILHELRTGELARTNRVPHTYYGSIDATPLFIMLAASYYDWTGDIALVREIQPNLEAALRWCLEWGDIDGDGYLEYKRRSAKGLVNQGWKDSGDGIVSHDGRLPKPPIGLVEVQGYLYGAYRAMARLRRVLDPADAAGEREMVTLAARLKERFNQEFWMPESSFYALGLDKDKRQIDAITSNPGHALWTGLIDGARAPHVADRLLSEDLFSGWGIRTLSTRSVTYNPLGYHLGTIWPHDNALIVAGLRRYGFDEAANRVLSAIFDVAQYFPYFRLPELFSGIPRTEHGVPIPYPVACSPQAWAAGALPCMIGQVLGLRPRDGGRVLEIIRPVLPSWMTRVRLRGLRVGQDRLDLTFTRSEHEGQPARVAVDGRSGTVEVHTYP